MIEIVITGIMTGGFAILGYWLAHRFSIKQMKSEKGMIIKENFLSSHVSLLYESAGIVDAIDKLGDKRVDKLIGSLWLTKTETAFTGAFRNYMENYIKMRLYFKDKKFERLLGNFTKTISKLNELISKVGPTSDEIKDFTKDKKIFKKFIKELTEVHNEQSKNQLEIQEYVINM